MRAADHVDTIQEENVDQVSENCSYNHEFTFAQYMSEARCTCKI